MDSRSDTAFIGDKAKFKQREDLMAKSRAKGDIKIAGMSQDTFFFVVILSQ